MKIFTLLALCAMTAMNASVIKPVVECDIHLEKDEYFFNGDEIFVNFSTVQDILEKSAEIHSFDAWEIIDYHIFIYVECETCGKSHLIDYSCPYCSNGQRII